MPRIAKIKKMININITVAPNCVIASSSELTSFFISGKALIERSGLSTRSVLKALRLRFDGKGNNSMMPTQTTVKSRMFQGSRRYAFLCQMKLMAKIFNSASQMKIMVNAKPSWSRILFLFVKF